MERIITHLNELKMKAPAQQKIIYASNGYEQLDACLQEQGLKHILLVCGRSIRFLKINDYFTDLPGRLGIQVTRFSDYAPNPVYESVEKGIRVYHENGCDGIVAVGGGSGMDVAKCIKLFARMDPAVNYLKQEIVENDIPLFAVPTTAGTGSEATRFAVIYYQGEKQSVSHRSSIPSVVLMDPSVLHSLPEYQRKATMLDALCHAVESFWSVNSTPESKIYARKAIQAVLKEKDAYLANTDEGNKGMLEAANIAGKAINITQTTAGHAMCYKLTTLYGISHGHAAALCVRVLWPYMLSQLGGAFSEALQQEATSSEASCSSCLKALQPEASCIDPRGRDYLIQTFGELADAFGCNTPEEAAEKFASLLEELGLRAPDQIKEEDYPILVHSVNPVRLKNNPIALTEQAIDFLYHEILG